MKRREFLGASAAAFASFFIPRSAVSAEDSRVIKYGDREKTQVVLTFDDGFSPAQVERILRVADDYSLRFTFFPVGWRVLDTRPDLWKNVVELGHEIQNHSHSHRILRRDLISQDEMVYDMGLHQVLLDDILGYHYPERFFRPPGGYIETAVISAAESLDFQVVTWSLSSGGTDKLATPNSSFGNVARATNGDIVLLHCINNDTLELPRMIDILQNKGLELVTLSNLLN